MSLPVTRLGRTRLPATRLGLGTVELGMPYGLGSPEPPADEDCIALLRNAVDLGIGYIDTAAAYGRSKALIGRAFDGVAEAPTIATKLQLLDADGRPCPAVEVAAVVDAAVIESLRRLRVDAIDLMQVHNYTPELGNELAEALPAALEAQVEAGRVRHWGASTYGPEAPLAALDCAPLATQQVAYSVLDRSLETAVLPACRAADVGLVLRSVFLKGVLTDRRHELPPALDGLRDAAAAVAAVGDGLGVELPEVALRFALFEAGADVVLVGTAAVDELAANVEAARAGPLPRDAVAALRAIRVDDPALLNPGNWPQ